MSLRDIIVIITIIGSLPFCFKRPWIGVLVWSWVGYMNPHRLTWGIAYNMPFAMMIAVATMTGIFFNKDKFTIPWCREVYLLLALWGLFLITTLNAFYPEDAWEYFDEVSKILLMSFITIALMNDKKKLMALTWVIALSIGFFGFKGGIWAVLTGGQWKVLGPPDTFIAGNTVIGLALNMVLPLFLFLRREETRPWLRHLMLAMFIFSSIASLVTYSRGAFVGLAVVLLLLVLKSKAKIIALILLIVAIPFVLTNLPEKWHGQMNTIETYEEDTSAMMRICVWNVAYRIALDNPLLGGGFKPFGPEQFLRYDKPECPRQYTSDAHSIYYQVLAEHGFPGFLLYMGIILSTMFSIRSLIRSSREDPSIRWIYNYSQMLEVSMMAFLVSGAFLSMSYFDLFFHFVAITIILKKFMLEHHSNRLELDK